ncbi:hypothetical protein H6P81_021143 [Aristolochia fimbriata]|uniref:Uncharacterized protein n=1 Tax=Aristolochia fimbriata TaxID=158543 RepID=A0AAV7DWK5_ARIFI|nr:hypothetical protein H6P81_021143 [Aristolochia fimbriata]
MLQAAFGRLSSTLPAGLIGRYHSTNNINPIIFIYPSSEKAASVDRPRQWWKWKHYNSSSGTLSALKHRLVIGGWKPLSTLPPNDHHSTEEDRDMDPNQPQEKKSAGDQVMSQSFGEAYATRSNEEGFGGIYGGNQSLEEEEEEEGVLSKDHDKSINRPKRPQQQEDPSLEKSQGSQVTEKEKGRNQPEDMSTS